MKRFISIILVFILALAAVGCNKPVSEANGTEAPKATEAAFTEEPALTTEPAETPEATEEPAFTEEPSEEPTPVPTAMPERPEEDPNLPKVIAGKDVFFITYPDGSLYAWGNNSFGQLGVGDTESRREPVLMANGLVPVIVGETVFALSSDNILWGWGRNDQGQLGTGDREDRSRPVELMHFVKAVTEVGNGFYALTEGGELYFWGYELNFTSSDEAEIKYVLEPKLLFENVEFFDGYCAIKDGGELWRKMGGDWERIAVGVADVWHEWDTVAIRGTDGRLYALCSGEDGARKPEPVLESFRSVTICDGVIYALDDHGTLYSYRAGFSSVLANESYQMHELIEIMNGVVEFAADTYMDEDWGYDYKLALKANGELWSWGYYWEPALGKTQMSDFDSPECVAHGVRSFVSTGAQTYIIAEDGSVWATGWSGEGFVFGGLGDGTDATRFGFVRLGIEGFCTIASRMDEEIVEYDDGTDGAMICCRTFAVDAEGRIFAWGWNGDGFLGTGSNEKLVLSPEEIVIED